MPELKVNHGEVTVSNRATSVHVTGQKTDADGEPIIKVGNVEGRLDQMLEAGAVVQGDDGAIYDAKEYHQQRPEQAPREPEKPEVPTVAMPSEAAALKLQAALGAQTFDSILAQTIATGDLDSTMQSMMSREGINPAEANETLTAYVGELHQALLQRAEAHGANSVDFIDYLREGRKSEMRSVLFGIAYTGTMAKADQLIAKYTFERGTTDAENN